MRAASVDGDFYRGFHILVVLNADMWVRSSEWSIPFKYFSNNNYNGESLEEK